MVDSASTREFLELARAGDDSAEWHLFSRFISELNEEARRHRLIRFLKSFVAPEDVVS